MAVCGHLACVPFEDVASCEYGNNGEPVRVTVATMLGQLAGPQQMV